MFIVSATIEPLSWIFSCPRRLHPSWYIEITSWWFCHGDEALLLGLIEMKKKKNFGKYLSFTFYFWSTDKLFSIFTLEKLATWCVHEIFRTKISLKSEKGLKLILFYLLRTKIDPFRSEGLNFHICNMWGITCAVLPTDEWNHRFRDFRRMMQGLRKLAFNQSEKFLLLFPTSALWDRFLIEPTKLRMESLANQT